MSRYIIKAESGVLQAKKLLDIALAYQLACAKGIASRDEEEHEGAMIVTTILNKHLIAAVQELDQLMSEGASDDS